MRASSIRKALYKQRERPNSGGSVDLPAINEPTRSAAGAHATQSDDKVKYRNSVDGALSADSRHHRVRSALASVSINASKSPKSPSPLTIETNGSCTCPGHISAEATPGAKALICPVHSAPQHLRSNSTSPQGGQQYHSIRGHSNSSYGLNAPLLIPLHGSTGSGSSGSMRSRLSSSMYIALSNHPTVVDFEDWHTSDKSKHLLHYAFQSAFLNSGADEDSTSSLDFTSPEINTILFG